MKGTAVFPAVLLLALTAHPSQASVVAKLTFNGAGTAAPVVVPLNIGNVPLGTIVDINLELCFKQPASPQGSCDQSGTVSLEEQLAPPFFFVAAFREALATGATTPVSFPVTLAAGQRLIVLSHWVPDRIGSVTDSLVLQGSSGADTDIFRVDLTGSGVPSGACVPSSQALCLGNGRFKVQSDFLSSTDSEAARGGELTDDTGYLYFFSPSNVEAVVKVLNACSFNNRFWVFAGGLTDVRTVISVTDTQRNVVKTYINPQGTPFRPIQDTGAFATCP